MDGDSGKVGWSRKELGLKIMSRSLALTWENGVMEPFLINILFKKAYTIFSLSGMESWVRRINGGSSIF